MPELRIVSGGDDLELRNRILIELSGWPSIQFILIGNPSIRNPVLLARSPVPAWRYRCSRPPGD
jgi:hypothetical protein